jgi:hypothetical protein
MELLFQIILIIHIIAGSLGLLTGTINILQKKEVNDIGKLAGCLFSL